MSGACILLMGSPIIDGHFDDWAEIPGIDDATGDGAIGGIDFLSIKCSLSDNELLVYLKTENPIDWRDSPIDMYFDTDGDTSTGLPLGVLGADYIWDFSVIFGRGDYYGFGSGIPLHKGTLISAGAPIGLSSEIEFAIPFNNFDNGSGQPTTVRFFLRANGTGDIIPQISGFQTVQIPLHQPAARIKPDWSKIADRDVRIISWNVLKDGPQAPDADQGAFGRQLQAIQPDIIHFQELYVATTTWLRAYLQEWIPAPDGKFWFIVKQNDCMTASLFPITRFWPTDNNLIVEINMESVWGVKAIMINAHTPHGDNEAGRITETSHMLDWINPARQNGTLQPDTPLFFIGDFNTGTITPEIISMRQGIYPDGSGRQVELIPGFGELRDLAPVQLDSPLTYTWRSSPTSTRARFDYIYYPANQIWAAQSFVLAPEKLSAESRERIGMLPADYYVADHKIFGGDFRLLESNLPGEPHPRLPEFLLHESIVFNRLNEPWVHAYQDGWIWTDPVAVEPSSDMFWFFHETHGWLASRKDIWPWIWNPIASSWEQL